MAISPPSEITYLGKKSEASPQPLLGQLSAKLWEASLYFWSPSLTFWLAMEDGHGQDAFGCQTSKSPVFLL